MLPLTIFAVLAGAGTALTRRSAWLRLALEEVREVGDHVITAVHGHGRGRLSGVELRSSFCQVWSLHGGTPTCMREYRDLEQGLASLRT